MAFRDHHIPAGLLDRKLNEFLALTQGTRTVVQYAQVFNQLCQYAGHHMDTDAKKRERFRRGLSTKLQERLNLVRADSWIRTIESKFSLLTVPCSEANMTRYAAQQFRRSARMWWDHYHGMLPDDHVVN